MAKLTLNNNASGFNSADLYNSNNALIEAAVEKTLSRDGTAPNSMSVSLDMGSNKIINLSNASANQEAVTKAQLDAYAANTLTSYNASAGTFNPAGYTSQTIENKLKEFVSVLDYGAVGDGNTDDTAAIQAAITALSDYQTLYFPPTSSFYKLTSGLTDGNHSGCTLQIDGTLKLVGAPGGTSIFTVNGNNNYHITGNGVLDGNSVTSSMGVQLTSTTGTRVSNLRFQNFTDSGIRINSGVLDLVVCNVYMQAGGYGILAQNPTTPSRRIIISNSSFAGGTGDAIELNSPSGTLTDVSIIGNTIENYVNPSTPAGFGIGLANCQRVSITSNIISNCGASGVHVEDRSSEVSIVGNVFTGNGTGPAPSSTSGIELNSSSTKEVTDVIIKANTISSSVGNGIEVIGTGRVARVNISDNTCISNGGRGISFSASDYSVISNNICRNNTTDGLYGGSVKYTTISGNVSTGNATDGLTISVSGGASTGLVISNNYVGGNTGVGYNIPSTISLTASSNASDASNTVASATTITAPFEHDYIYITGITNITGITASWPGRVLILEFAGVLTVSDDVGGLRLAGDFVTAANSFLTLVSNGTNWKEVSRSVN